MAELKTIFPSNSIKERNSITDEMATKKDTEAPKKEIKKVATAKKVKEKKGEKFLKEFKSAFFTNCDDEQSIWNYILFDLVIPSAKDLIYDTICNATSMRLFGNASGGFRSRRSSESIYYTSYSDYWRRGGKSKSSSSDREREHMRRRSDDVEPIILDTRRAAEAVIDQMDDILSQYGVVTVMDVYSMVDIAGNFTDDDWGWKSLRGVTIRPLRDGYQIILPKPVGVISE